MKGLLRRRPSGAMVVSIVALVVAASGTALAATSLIKGDSLIKKRSLSGNRLRNHTVTGTQVNLNKLGKVPNAKKADLATLATLATNASHANSATNATTATNAGQAANAANLGGQPASAYLPASALHRKFLTLNAGQPGAVLLQQGAVAEAADCTTTGAPQITGTISQASTVANWLDFSTVHPLPGLFPNDSASSTTTSTAGQSVRVEVSAPDGDALLGQAWVVVNYPVAGQCTFGAFAVSG